MEPTIKRGSLVYDEVVPTGELRVGDVITYVQPATRSPTTHRIVRARARRRRPARLPHQGRQQRRGGPAAVHARPAGAGALAFAIPYVGYLFILLADPSGADRRCSRCPALLIALLDARAAVARRRRACWSSGDEALLVLAALALAWRCRSPRPDAQASTRAREHGDGHRRSATRTSTSTRDRPQPDPAAGCYRLRARRGSNPQVLAGERQRRTLAVHMGGWRGQDATTRDCVLTIRAPATFPAGVTQITLHGERARRHGDRPSGRSPPALPAHERH